MKKSQIPYGALIGLVLFLIVFVAAVSWANGLFRLSSQASNDFYALDSSIKSVSSKEILSTDNLPLRLDDKTAVMIFKNDSLILQVSGISSASTYATPEYTVAVIKPTSCIGTCLCLCQKVVREGSSVNYECSKNICLSGYTKSIIIFSSQLSCDNNKENCIGSSTGGYMVERDAIFTKNVPRARSLWVQKINKTAVAICDQYENGMCLLPKSI